MSSFRRFGRGVDEFFVTPMHHIRRHSGTAWFAALTAAVALSGGSTALGGNQGAYMNSLGYGKAASSIAYNGVISSVLSPAQYYPCAAVNPLSTFTCANPPAALPDGTASTVYCQAKGGPNYQWKIQSYVTGGATADNPALDARVNVIPAPCASYEMESMATFVDAFSGSVTVNATATPGAALWLRGYEYLGPGQPADLADLIANGALKWDFLLMGPFNLNQADCTAMTIPFTTQTGHANLYFVTDAVAKSIPFSVNCGGDVTFNCTDPLVYPPATVTGGCGNVSVTYSPAAQDLPPGATLVTATATDAAGNTAQCTFTATRYALGFNGFFSPINGTGGSCSSPIRSVNQGSIIPVKFSTSCQGSTFLGGSPSLSITRCVNAQPVGSGNFQPVANEWHYNWDTSGLAKGTYELIATLQDGSQRSVYVRLR